MLNEEKWTRATIDNYAIKNFQVLDELIEEAEKEEVDDKLRLMCLEHLTHMSNSIIGLYIAGIISLRNEIIDDDNIYQVINLFMDNRKWSIVEYLSDKVLDIGGEDIVALNTLMQCYEMTGKTEDLRDLWERIVKVDFENGEVARKLAEINEKEGNTEKAIFYYKMALRRYTKKNYYSAIEELWIKLSELIPEELEFFYQIEKEVAKKDLERAATFLSLLVPYFMDNSQYDKAITILKKILHYLPKDREARQQLVKCYKEYYGDHSQLDEYIKKSAIGQSWKKIDDAISMFERHIAFDKGNYVYHRSWGIGKIVQCQHDSFTIDFQNKKNHQMSLQMALNSLKVLPEDHLWIIKMKDIDRLKDDSEEGMKDTLITILKSYNNTISMKEIKEEMSDIIGAKSWTKWWTKAKKIIKKEPIFGNKHNNRNIYILRDKPLSLEEELFEEFKSSSTFDEKTEVVLDFFKHESDLESEELNNMLTFFLDHLHKEEITINTIKSYFILRRLKKLGKSNPTIRGLDVRLSTINLLKAKVDFAIIYDSFSDIEIKKDFISVLKKEDPMWHASFLEILETKPTRLHNDILQDLMLFDDKEYVRKAVRKIQDDMRKDPENYIWFVKVLFHQEESLPKIKENLFEFFDIDPGATIFAVFKLLDLLSRDIENKKDKTLNKKYFNMALDALLKENIFVKYLDEADEDFAKKSVALIKGIYEMDEKSKLELFEVIKSKFPDVELADEEVGGAAFELHPFMVTKKALAEKQKELQHILNVEIPNNSKDISVAKELGDLRENAEYAAAIEQQKLLQETAKKLSEELRQVKIVSPDEVSDNVVNFGTQLDVKNLDTKKKETYTILGEWDSDPEQNIISYRSPLGRSLIGKKVKDKVKFTHGGIVKKFQVLNIKVAKF